MISCLRPKPGREDALLEIVRDHMPTLRAESLITDRDPIFLRASDGTILEVFEWRSREAVEEAHANPRVLELWARFDRVCDYVTLADLPEVGEYFPNFDPVDV